MGLRHRSSSFFKASTPQSHTDSLAQGSSQQRQFTRQRSFEHCNRRTNPPVPSSDLISLTTPTCYELSLAAMYTHHVLANRSRTPSLSNSLNSASSAGSPDLPAGDIPRHLLAHEPTRSQTPAPVNHNSPYAPQPLSMPPHFITSFVHRCFVVDLAEVDFTQALKAMDYLKVFDDRRKREFCAALRRLNIDTSIWDYEKASIMNENPSMYDWIVSVEDKSRRVEALYTQVYIGLRRWVSIALYPLPNQSNLPRL